MANSNVTDEEARAAYEAMTRPSDEPAPAWWRALDDHAAYYLALCRGDEAACLEMEREARAKLRAAMLVFG